MNYTIKLFDNGWRYVIKFSPVPFEVSQTGDYKAAKQTAVESTIDDNAITCIIKNNNTGNCEVWSDGVIVYSF